jgi:signal transduction histidine kinase/DNA-binding response OmpR family regulator
MPRVLVIEDSPTQALELRLILESEGFAVEVAPTGQAGLEHLAAQPIDLVLSDVLLPDLSGYEVCRRIKTDPRTREVPVVLLTVLNDPLDILQGLECGADNFLTKPCEPRFLLERLRRILASRNSLSMGRGRARHEHDSEVVLSLGGKSIHINSDKEQMVNLLLTTLEDFIHAREREHEARVAREALERSEQFIRAALDALSTRVAILDHEGTVLAVNAAWQRSDGQSPLFGPGCGVGTNYLAACAAASTAEGRAIAEGIRAVAAGGRDGCSQEYASAADPPRWFAVRVTRFDETQPVRVVVAHEEVTDGKRLEAALRQRAEDLVEANRRRTELQALLAHELRNPLGPILNGLQILRRPGVDPRTRDQALEAAERQVRHLGHLVTDLLEVSRLGLGKVPLRTERLDLARLVRAGAEDRRLALEKAGLALRVDTPETPVWVRGDSTRLTQVLANLLDNSKFTDPGGRIEVRLEAAAGARQGVLTIRDTGIGMDADTLHHLFQPFRQAEQGLDRARGGLGLGLWVVKALVELHGGQVDAASAGPGRGSIFTVRLPLEPEPDAVAGEPAQRGAAPQRLRIVVIEDNRDAAESLRLLLEVMGHEVTVARTGPEGVQTAARCRPDVVVSDIGLPDLDGYGVARELRRRPETARTRLVALTGYGSEDDRRRSREAGFDFHLCKPADPQELMQLLVPDKRS